ncbi:MAG: GAF domain-containing protein [Chloroflexi bacterium]|nr:GAF domain-containing protein [Chloroflexota bacterium]
MSSLIAIAVGLAYIALMGSAWRFRESAGSSIMSWLLATLSIAALTSVIGIVPRDTDILGVSHLGQPALAVYAASLLLIIYSALTAAFLQQPRAIRLWSALGGVWWIAVVILSLVDGNASLAAETWISAIGENPHAAGLLAIAGWLALSGVLLISIFEKFYTARLPELANQALFWGVVTPLPLLGAIMGASSVAFLRETGWIIQLVGLASVTYGVISLRVVDVRETLRIATVNISLMLVTVIAVLVALLVAEEIEAEANRVVVLAGVALATAAIHAPIYAVSNAFANRVILRTTDDLATEINQFTQAITGVFELSEVTDVMIQTLRDVLRLKRSSVLLISPLEDGAFEIEPYQPKHSANNATMPRGHLTADSPIYQRLFEQREVLLQYDLDYKPEYTAVDPTTRNFFKQLHLAAYAPIVVQGQLIALLACGPKLNDTPFSERELATLKTLANQAGIALRNARLVSDLRTREHDIAESNRRLEAAKRQLEALDAVKTDFITIASHELRTPLAQIRGHTDIIDAMNEQGMLDQDQLYGLTTNLRKAADRLESLIGDMLDVSQLDLSAMDLRFVEASIENVVRMAIEPLQESIRNRRQSLTARGLRGLPPIQADMQRLVQAIRNVVLNAVKFTPDSGRIEITGRMLTDQQTGQQQVQITISDSGIGIDKQNQEAIFQKFFRIGDPGLHSTGATKFMGAGPGLGLTIAQGVIQGHGGRIWAESDGYDPEKLPGSTFYIVLPLQPPVGERRVMSFRLAGEASPPDTDEVRPTQPKKPEGLADRVQPNSDQEPPAEEDEVFEETNPTVFNPSASRAGLTAAALAAAQEQSEHGLESAHPPGDKTPPDEPPEN